MVGVNCTSAPDGSCSSFSIPLAEVDTCGWVGQPGKTTRMAFAFTIVGYFVAFIWAIITRRNRYLVMISMTYFLSVLMLSICNKSLQLLPARGLITLRTSFFLSVGVCTIFFFTFCAQCWVEGKEDWNMGSEAERQDTRKAMAYDLIQILEANPERRVIR